jgi:hypothetical protein
MGSGAGIQRLSADDERAFPNLNKVGYRVTSEATPQYNCIAFAAGDTTKW